MKKIIIALCSCIFAITFIGCGKISYTEKTNIENGKLFDMVRGINNNASIVFYPKSEYSEAGIEITLPFESKDNKISEEYNKDCQEIVGNYKLFDEYSELNRISFVAQVDGENSGPYLKYKKENDEYKLQNDSLSVPSDFEKMSDEERKKYEEELNGDTRSAEEIIEVYLGAWKNKNYDSMYKVSQQSWKDKNKEDVLESWYSIKDLKEYKIQNVKGNDTSKKIEVECKYTLGSKQEKKVNITFVLINENGEWKVNPESGLSEK